MAASTSPKRQTTLAGGFVEVEFHNTGLYNLGDDGGYPAPNTGVHAVTEDPEDIGRFKAPSLRNIALTAPYMHDGSIATLEEVIAHYEAGGRTITSGEYQGVGGQQPAQEQLRQGLHVDAAGARGSQGVSRESPTSASSPIRGSPIPGRRTIASNQTARKNPYAQCCWPQPFAASPGAVLARMKVINVEPAADSTLIRAARRAGV
jgi:hypothetical protein